MLKVRNSETRLVRLRVRRAQESAHAIVVFGMYETATVDRGDYYGWV